MMRMRITIVRSMSLMKIKVDFKGEEVYENNTCLDVWMYMNVQAGYTPESREER